ncbi:MAG TPA: DUF2188 domain-containing protein [Thermoanaerobaculia bacterium]|nr:DUF2188 domain-containing protein [Thermoanaerobaculia bacterium]
MTERMATPEGPGGFDSRRILRRSRRAAAAQLIGVRPARPAAPAIERPTTVVLSEARPGAPRRVQVRPLDDVWELRLEAAAGNPSRREVFDAKWQAVAAARVWARRYAPSELVIERSDGTHQIRHRYDEAPPR